MHNDKKRVMNDDFLSSDGVRGMVLDGLVLMREIDGENSKLCSVNKSSSHSFLF